MTAHDPLPALSRSSARVLRGHRTGVPAYRAFALGRVRTAGELTPIDVAYAELVRLGLMEAVEPALVVMPGETRTPDHARQALTDLCQVLLSANEFLYVD